MVDWRAVSAIGTLLAVVAALFISLFGPWAWNKIFGPRVSIEFDRGWPFIVRTEATHRARYVEVEGGGKTLGTIDVGPSFWIRIRIRNKGASVARQCKVKLVKVRYACGEKDLERFDPVILRWVSPPSGPDQFKPLDILSEETELCNVLSLDQADAPVARIECDREPRGAVTNLSFEEHANYWLEVVAFGENFSPARKTLKLEGTGHWRSGSYVPVLEARALPKRAE